MDRPLKVDRFQTAVKLLDSSKPGDHIVVRNSDSSWHHGIFVGKYNGSYSHVIDVWGNEQSCRWSLREFDDFVHHGVDFVIVRYFQDALPLESSLSLAQGLLKEHEHVYDGSYQKYEHIVTWCRTSKTYGFPYLQSLLNQVPLREPEPMEFECKFLP